MKVTWLALSAAAVLVTACETGTQMPQSRDPSQIYDTRAFLFADPLDCVATGGEEEVVGIGVLATIFAPLLETAVKEGVKFLGKSLEDASKKKEKSISAIANEHFYLKKDNGVALAQRCLVVVRGAFGPVNGQTAFAGPWSRGDRAELVQRINLAAPPDLYLELALRPSDDNSALKFRLGALEYHAPLLRGLSEQRDLAIVVILQSPQKKSEKNEAQAFAIGGISVESVAVGSNLGVEALKGKETAWLPMLPLADERTESLTGLENDTKIAPFSAFVTVTETRDGSKFLQFLSGVFKAQEEVISTEATRIIIDFTGLGKKD